MYQIKENLIVFNLVGEHEVKLYTWVITLIYLSQGAKVKFSKIDNLPLMCKCPFHITNGNKPSTYTMALSLNETQNCLKLYDWAFALPLSFPQKKKRE